MLLSLFKVALLTCFSGLSFIKTDSSLVHNDLSVNEEVNFNKAEKKNLYYSVYNHYVKLSQNDFDEGYLDSFSYPNTVVTNVNYSLNVKRSNLDTESTINFITYQFKDGVFIGKSESTTVDLQVHYSILNVDFANKNIHLDFYREGDIYNSANVDYVIFNQVSVNGYSTFFNFLKDYIKNVTTITLTPNKLNHILYSSTASYLLSLNDSVINNIQWAYISDSGSAFKVLDDNIHIFDCYDEDYRVDLYLEGSYKGYWFLNDVLRSFENNFYLYTYDTDIYRDLINHINIDEGNNLQNNYVASFVFDRVFNYNAPYDTELKSVVIQDEYFDSLHRGVENGKLIYIPCGYFEVGDKLYNWVVLKYVSAYDYCIRVDTNNDYIADSYSDVTQDGYGFFYQMYYENEDTNDRVIVYNRNVSQVKNANNFYANVIGEGAWVNSAYRTLRFLSIVNGTQIDELTNLNNNGGFNNLIVDSSDVEITESFRIINLGLNGLVGLLNIQVLPNVTLGMLVLVPFAVSLLFLAISFFKR